MKSKLNIILITALVVSLLSGITTKLSEAKTEKEEILSYSSEMVIDKKGNAEIVEQIIYYFPSSDRHGIYRTIPVIYKDRNGNPWQTITNIRVTDENGNVIKHETNGLFVKTIKIGDQNSTVNGKKTYIIKYHVNRVIDSEKGADVLNWNFIGDGWNVEILSAQITIRFPIELGVKVDSANCFIGSFGSEKSCGENVDIENADYLVYQQKNLNSHQALTVRIQTPSGTFPTPNFFELFFWESRWWLLMPIGLIVFFFYLWRTRGRDHGGNGTIVAQYEAPKGIEPIEAAYIIGQSMEGKYFSSQLIYLAIKKVIKINYIDDSSFLKSRDYELQKIKEYKGLKEYDELIISSIFKSKDSVRISELKNKFNQDYEKIKKSLYHKIIKEKIYVSSPVKSRLIYFSLASLALVVSFFLGIVLYQGILGWLILLAGPITAYMFALVMPKKSRKGMELMEHLLGLREYIKVAEKDRIRFHNAPAKTPEKFEELLPYAMIFGLEKEWAAAFSGIYKEQPDWFNGNVTNFSAITLAKDLGGFSSTANASFTSVSSGGGGGFAGGGGGGGGGGSW